MSDEKDEKKEIEVVSGDGSDLDISPVYEHIEAIKPKHRDQKPKDIVIPGEKKKEEEEKKEDSKN